MALPLVTIVTPSYNQGHFLEETIQSVLGQSYPNIEYIIIDGGSTDQSIEIIKKYESRISYWVSETDQGQTDAINKGFRMGKGDLVGWINSDDFLEPTAVEQIVSSYQSHPDSVLFHGKLRVVDANGQVIEVRDPRRKITFNGLLNGLERVSQPGSFYSRSAIEGVGFLDPGFQMVMDFDLWIKLLGRGPATCLPGILANYRLHGETKSKNLKELHWKEMKLVLQKHGAKKISLRQIEIIFLYINVQRINFLRKINPLKS